MPWKSSSESVATDPIDARVDQAIALTKEVSDKIRERANSIHPFRGVLTDLLIGPQAVVDVTLIADAYEMSQEARIFHGPNGHRESRRNYFKK